MRKNIKLLYHASKEIAQYPEIRKAQKRQFAGTDLSEDVKKDIAYSGKTNIMNQKETTAL